MGSFLLFSDFLHIKNPLVRFPFDHLEISAKKQNKKTNTQMTWPHFVGRSLISLAIAHFVSLGLFRFLFRTARRGISDTSVKSDKSRRWNHRIRICQKILKLLIQDLRKTIHAVISARKKSYESVMSYLKRLLTAHLRNPWILCVLEVLGFSENNSFGELTSLLQIDLFLAA